MQFTDLPKEKRFITITHAIYINLHTEMQKPAEMSEAEMQ